LNLKKKKTGAITCDAYHMTDPRADGLGVSTCIELALKDARIEKEQVNYINAHATSTLVGDVAEVKAVRKVFTDTKGIAMNGTKSMIGHCLGAAGGMEAVATIQAIRTGWVRILLHFFSYIFLASKKKNFRKKHLNTQPFFFSSFISSFFFPPLLSLF
jgi:3-oxoacyl-(acyl-carrier-protein) synthase